MFSIGENMALILPIPLLRDARVSRLTLLRRSICDASTTRTVEKLRFASVRISSRRRSSSIMSRIENGRATTVTMDFCREMGNQPSFWNCHENFDLVGYEGGRTLEKEGGYYFRMGGGVHYGRTVEQSPPPKMHCPPPHNALIP